MTLRPRRQGLIRDRRSFPDRFWSKVDKENGPFHPVHGKCWIWLGATTHNGYGNFQCLSWRHEAASTRAHRIAWELEHGAPPAEVLVLHHCDNRKCARPSHLFLGTASDNSTDMAIKGRTTSPLNDESVLAILASPERSDVLAERFGVGDGTIQNIRAGRTWGHLRAVRHLDDSPG